MTVDWKALPVHLAVEQPDLISARRHDDAEFFELERPERAPRVLLVRTPRISGDEDAADTERPLSTPHSALEEAG